MGIQIFYSTSILNRYKRYLGMMFVFTIMIPAIAFSQTVNLRTATNFGVLSYAAITGTANITGNVGTLSGTIAGTITAAGYTVYPVNDPVVQTAHNDLFTAYEDAASRGGAVVLSDAAFELGNSTRSPGVYKIGSAASIATGTLTLDGAGVYIFQIGSTLITSSNVSLTNGAVWTDIFWQVGSSATLGASSIFEGTILANTSITANDGATIHGRLLAGAVTATGAVSLTNNTALPVELTSFTAELKSSAVELNWNTATEVNNYGFNVERRVQSEEKNIISLSAPSLRAESVEWQTIGFVPGHGNSNSPKDYFYKDISPQAGKLLYRLKQIDFDGTSEYSDVLEIDIKPPVNFILDQNYPNPFNPTTYISYAIPLKLNVAIKIYNILGREVAVLLNEEKSPGRYQVEFKAMHLTSGIYFYSIVAGENKPITRKMILLK